MKPGDLVRIYKFPHKVRKRLAPGVDGTINDYEIGLITKGAGELKYGHYRGVLKSHDGNFCFYSIHRLEVIESE
jgi:hypothetical protein